MQEEEEEEEEILDSEWIADFDKIDKIYQCYYQSDISQVKIRYVFINSENEIEKIKCENVSLTRPNFISKEDIIRILKRYNTTNYTILSILKYNIDIGPPDIKRFIQKRDYSSDFLSSVKNFDGIVWNPTITMFQDLNEIFIFFYRKDDNSHNKTKRIHIHSHNAGAKRTIRNYRSVL